MMPCQIQLIACDEETTESSAGFVAGYEPGAWLGELKRLGVLHHDRLELYIVPDSPHDRMPAGLFFVATGATLRMGSWRCHPYKVLAGNLYIPVGTALSLPLTAGETQRLFPMHRHVLHPGIGHVAFELADQMLASELVESPCLLEADWHRVHPGLPPSPSLSSVELHMAETAKDLLDEGRGDIGTQANDILDEAEDKGDGPLYRMKRGGLLGLSALGGFLDGVFGGGFGPSPKGGLQGWTEKALAKLEQKRHRELDRLLKLLRDNPAEGLKYALPLNSRTFARGQARPSGSLGSRSTNFSFSALGGGGAVDPWYIQDQMLEDLRKQYREAAARHSQAGEHDRAAYIYAELLGDYHAAAAVLKEGKRYQEAAKIYQDLLKRPLDAAKCLAEGGMLQAAAELYAELERHESAGDLYERCGNRARARYHFRLAVERELAQGNYLHAATLAENRLELPDEAEEILLRAWPDSADAVPCMKQYLARLEAAEEHGACLRKLRELRAEAGNTALALQTLHVFCALRAAGSAHTEAAADHGMMLVGESLPAAGKAAARRRLVAVLPKLVPADAVLLRDATRHMQLSMGDPRPAPRRPPPATVGEMTQPALTLRLPAATNWSRIFSDGETILALGSGTRQVVLRQMTFADRERSVCWDECRSETTSFLWCRHDRGHVDMFSGETERFAPKEFARSATFPDELVARTRPCTPDAAIVAACEVRAGIEILHWTGDDLRLSRFMHGGSDTPDREVDLRLGQHITPGLDGTALWHWQGTTNIVMGDLHTIVTAGGDTEFLDLPAPATCAAVSAPFSAYRVAVADHQGIQLYWPGRNYALCEPVRLTYDFVPHCMLFLGNGMLAAASADEVRVFRTKNQKAEPLVRIPTGSSPVALARGSQLNELAVLCANSAIRVYALA